MAVIKINKLSWKSKFSNILLTLVLLSLGCFVAGLQHFVLTLPKKPKHGPQKIDGIVVITGGQQRLTDGLKLLSSREIEKMLVSGVGPGVNKKILARELTLNSAERAKLDCCVELEFEANNTRDNASAAKIWAKKNNLESLILVTANYHMPRAKFIFTSKMPNMSLQFWPTSPADLDIRTWWQKASILRLLAKEYAKYLTVSFRDLA